jgi:hypothetical protein
MSKSKKKTFDVTKAVKSNARDRVGSPKPSRPIKNHRERELVQPKHKKTFSDLLDPKDDA